MLFNFRSFISILLSCVIVIYSTASHAVVYESEIDWVIQNVSTEYGQLIYEFTPFDSRTGMSQYCGEPYPYLDSPFDPPPTVCFAFGTNSQAKDDLVSGELHVWSGGGGHKIDELLDVIIIYSAKLERNVIVTNIVNPLNMQPAITFVGWNGVFSPLIRYSFTQVSLPAGAK